MAILGHEWDLLFKLLRTPLVITVAECDESTRSMSDGVVACDAGSGVFVESEQFDPAVVLCIFIDYPACAVGGAVVRDKQLPIRIGLG